MSEDVPNRFYLAPVISARCLKTEFDSTYPVHLNGIIAQDEFQQSIANINRAVSSRTSLFSVFGIFIALFLLTGFILFVVGGFDAVNSHRSGFPPLVGVGFGLFGCSMVVCICGCFVLQSGLNRRVREAITAESIKYSSRSPSPCSWRLHSRTTWWTGPDNQQRASTNFCVSTFSSPFNSTVPRTIIFHCCR